MALVIPNGIENDTPVDAAEIQQNFDAIQTYVNSSLINRDGSVAMQQPLTLPGDPTNANHAANKDYVDGHDALYLPLAGGTMTGNLTVGPTADLLLPTATSKIGFGSRFGQHIDLRATDYGIGVQGGVTYFRTSDTGTFRFFHGGVHSDTAGSAGTGGIQSVVIRPTYLELPTTQSTDDQAAVHRKYVDDTFVNLAGDTMTGELVASGGVQLPAGTPPLLNAVRRDYVEANFVELGVAADGNITLGAFPDANAPTAGTYLSKTGSVFTTVPAAAAINTPNMIVGRGGTPAANTGGQYIRFDRGASAIGTITIASASSVAYNETSDPRLKEQTGDVADAADLVHDLGAKAFRGRWIADQGHGEEWVFLNSTDIETVAPFAVTGDADAVDGDGIVPQQVNYPSLVPLLFAALSQALDRIAALEAA